MESTLFPYAVGAISALLAMLVTVLGWVGSQINARLKSLGDEMKSTNYTLTNIERDLRGELSRLDRRVSVVEAQTIGRHQREA